MRAVLGAVLIAGAGMASQASQAPVPVTAAEVRLSGVNLNLATVLVGSAEPTKDEVPRPRPLIEGWKRQAEAGITGSDGNSEAFNLRFGFEAKRKTTENETLFNASYLYNTSDGEKTKSRGESNLRNDFVFGDSPWGFFALGKVEYDEFQSWLWRLSAYAGPSYSLIKQEDVLLRFRAGAGLQKELGRENRNEVIPEALLGVDYEWKITKVTKFFVTADFLPSLRNFSDYRVNGKTGIEIMVDPELNLSLKAGIEDRYNSNPGEDKKKNDVEYFLTLAVSF
jgi:putative salt-induced outer membrane protein YdiY